MNPQSQRMTRAAGDEPIQVRATPWAGIHLTRAVSRRSFPRHWHEVFGLGLIEAGGQRSASGRGVVEGRAGDIITVNPGEVHDGHALGGEARRWTMLYLEPATMHELLGDAEPLPGRLPELTRPVLQDPALRRALQQALGAALALTSGRASAPAVPVAPLARGSSGVTAAGGTPPDAVARLAADAALATLGAVLRRHCDAPAATAPPCRLLATDAALSRVRQRLADDLLIAPSLAELASQAGLSRFQLLRRFQARYGLPPHAWLQQARLQRARQLIADGAGLADAALGSGFADQSHLTRLFRRQFGYTPGAWRAAQRRRRGG